MSRVYHIGDRIQLTDYSGKQFLNKIDKIVPSILGLNEDGLGLDRTSKLFLHGDNTPYLLDSFQEFETLGIRLIKDKKNLALVIGEKQDRRVA